MNLPIIVGIVTGLGGSLFVYLVALRKLSGTVKHSEAEQLWAESKAIREDLQERNEFLTGRLDRCESRVATLEERIDFLADANATLREENFTLKARLGAV